MYLALLGACIGSITPKGWEKQAYKDAKGVKEYAEVKTKYTGRTEQDRSCMYCGE